MSVKQLPEEIQKCYLDLAVFPEDTLIPECALTVIWGREGKEVRRIASQLVNRSLATRDASTHLSLHDLQVDYVRNEDVRKQAGVESVSALHGRFLEVYAGRCTEGWPTGPHDGYYFERLPWHLKEAGKSSELDQLLRTFEWLQAKLEATDVNALVADYDYLPEAKDLQLVQSAIRLSAHVVARDPRQLAGQLTGRLVDSANTVIEALLTQALEKAPRPWFRPIRANLIPPGGSLIRTLEGHTDSVSTVVVTADSRRAISGSNDGTLRLWDLGTGQTLRTLKGHKGRVSDVAVTPDGRRAVSASWDKTLRLWDLESGQTIRTLKGHTRGVSAVAVMADGRRAVSASGDKTLRVWDLSSGQTLRTLKGHRDESSAVSLTPDGRRAVSASYDGTLRLWDLESGQTLRTLQGHTGIVLAVSVTPDGLLAVSASYDGTLRLWDLESGKKIATFTGESGMESCAVAPDGRTIVAGDKLGRVHFLRIVEADEKKSPMGDTRIPLLHREEQATSVTDS